MSSLHNVMIEELALKKFCCILCLELKNTMKNIFTSRLVEHWNTLPGEAVVAPSLTELRNFWTIFSGAWCDS